MDQAAVALGVRPALGGRHPQWGTWNALLSLGDGVYLEWVAQDPAVARDGGGPATVFGVDQVQVPRLMTWCARDEALERTAARARSEGIDLGPVLAGGRDRPDGSRVEWKVTDPRMDRTGGLLPFLIDWGTTPHPSGELPGGAKDGLTLSALWIEHPDPDEIRRRLQSMGVEVPVRLAGAPALVANLSTPLGSVVHRSDRPTFPLSPT
jgi:hypothetical protein